VNLPLQTRAILRDQGFLTQLPETLSGRVPPRARQGVTAQANPQCDAGSVLCTCSGNDDFACCTSSCTCTNGMPGCTT
jgi:hypothetical protein